MKKQVYKNYFLAVILVLTGMLMLASLALAETNKPEDPNPNVTDLHDAEVGMWNFGEKTGYSPGKSASPEVEVGRIIAYALSFLGVVFMILIVYGGYMWLTARGNEEQITKAKDLIKHSIIGMVIVFAAFMVSYFVVDRILMAVILPS